MTDQPPPPPLGGEYPPPPPPSGGVAPPPPGPAIRDLPPQAYTSWLARVGAYLIDLLPFLVIVGAGWLVLQNSVESACLTDIRRYDVNQICSVGYSTLGLTVMWASVLVGLIYLVWNFGYRQGVGGSSIGKSVLNFKVVSENTGQPIGFAMSLLRQICHTVDAVPFYVGYLCPLWTAKRQTLADKIMATVCLPLEQAPTPRP
jgi:uncharacterized RDD family membrane protein YckC